MKQSLQARLEALHRMKAFLDENADAVGVVNKSASRTALDDVLTSVEDRAQAQDAAETQAASATEQKNALREDLRLHHMQPIAAIARSALAHTPLIAQMRLPHIRVNDSTLISNGAAMARVAEQYSDVFIGEQLPADFLAQLKKSVDDVRAAAVQRDGFEIALTQATQAVENEMARAHNIVKVLHTLVVKQLKGKTDLLAGWHRAKHAKAKPGVPRGTKRTQPAAPAAPAQSPVAPSTPTPVAPAAPAATAVVHAAGETQAETAPPAQVEPAAAPITQPAPAAEGEQKAAA